MAQEPYRSAPRVFWVMDNGSSHRGERSDERIQSKWKNIVPVHRPVHASWLNQVEVYFSVVQRKVLTPNDFDSLAAVEDRLKRIARFLRCAFPLMTGASILFLTMSLRAPAATGVTLSNASFNGLTRIVVATNVELTGLDAATLNVSKTMSAILVQSVILSNAQLRDLTHLTFDTNIELQQRIPNANAGNRGTYTYIREESVLNPDNLIITKGNGSVIPAKLISGIVVNPAGVQVTLAKGAFASEADASRATVATRAYYQFAAGAPERYKMIAESHSMSNPSFQANNGYNGSGWGTDDGKVLNGQYFDNPPLFNFTLTTKNRPDY